MSDGSARQRQRSARRRGATSAAVATWGSKGVSVTCGFWNDATNAGRLCLETRRSHESTHGRFGCSANKLGGSESRQERRDPSTPVELALGRKPRRW